MPVSEEIRRQIATLARHRRRRTSDFTMERPTRWRPQTVNEPESGLPFTDRGAWNFVADCIEEGHELQERFLRKPEGARGYVMHIRLEANRSLLYVKVELVGGRLWGRSFHYSEH